MKLKRTISPFFGREITEIGIGMPGARRCVLHSDGIQIPVRYLLEAPVGNILPLCVSCCAWWRAEAAATPDDLYSQPVRITEIAP